MNWRAECAAVIPGLNEETTIGWVVTAVRVHLPTVLVVDDGSADRTAALAAEAGAEVLRHQTTGGKGAALQSGWQRARQRRFKWTLMLDGDGQHSPDDIPAFLRCAESREVDLVVGNRMGEAAQMPWLRRVVNRWMSRQISKAAGRWLPDTQCGFRLMNLEASAGLALRAAHFEIESELLFAFLAAGRAVEFVPIKVIYRNEQSKIHPLRDTLRWLRWWGRARKLDGNAETLKR